MIFNSNGYPRSRQPRECKRAKAGGETGVKVDNNMILCSIGRPDVDRFRGRARAEIIMTDKDCAIGRCGNSGLATAATDSILLLQKANPF